MRDWFKRCLTTTNEVEDSPDCGREMRLIVNVLPGVAAITTRAPEDCSPAEPDEFDILSGVYEDDSAVPRAVLDSISDDTIQLLMDEEVARKW